jgi:hypothetical protein
MDLWGMAGVSRQTAGVALAIGVAAAIILARFVLRRDRGQRRVHVDLSGRGE